MHEAGVTSSAWGRELEKEGQAVQGARCASVRKSLVPMPRSPQVPSPEERLRQPGGGMVLLRLSRVQHAAPAHLRGQVSLAGRTQGPSLERQLGHSDPKILGRVHSERLDWAQAGRTVIENRGCL